MTPSDWHFGTLAEDVEIISGQHILADDCTTEVTPFPYLTGPADFPLGRIQVTKYVRSPKVLCRAGDILITVKGSGTGKLARADASYCISRQLAAARTKSWDQDFLVHLLVAHADRFHSDASGLIPGLTREDLLGLAVQVPPLGEQRKIAAILSSVDEAIEATQAVIEQLQVVKKAMMAELLTRGLPGRHTRFKQTEIGEVPEEWEVVRIESLGPAGVACVRSGPFGSSMKTSDFRKSGTPVLTIQSLGEGVVMRDGLFFVDEAKTAELAEYKVRPNDLVFSRVADIGRCAAIGENEEGWLISPNLSRIRLDRAKADAAFLMYSLTAESPVRRQIEMQTGDAGRPVISSGTLKSIAIPLPTVEEQSRILAAGREIEGRLMTEEDALRGIRALKSALMSVLLTGEIRVKPDEETP